MCHGIVDWSSGLWGRDLAAIKRSGECISQKRSNVPFGIRAERVGAMVIAGCIGAAICAVGMIAAILRGHAAAIDLIRERVLAAESLPNLTVATGHMGSELT